MHVEQLSLFDEFDLEHKELCPFLNRRVSVTGVFTLGRQALKSKLLKLGASDVRFDALQRNTHFLLVGEMPNEVVMDYWRMYVHDGFNIKLLSLADFEEIDKGRYAVYHTEEIVSKKLHLTKEHLYWNAPEIEGLKNTRPCSPFSLCSNHSLYGKEIYMHVSLVEQMHELPQLMGCIGAYVNTEIDEKTELIIMPKDMPAIICQCIEEYYNASRATQFNIPFVILEDLLSYLHERLVQIPEPFMKALLDKLPPSM